jgi:hypothetical protein
MPPILAGAPILLGTGLIGLAIGRRLRQARRYFAPGMGA